MKNSGPRQEPCRTPFYTQCSKQQTEPMFKKKRREIRHKRRFIRIGILRTSFNQLQPVLVITSFILENLHNSSFFSVCSASPAHDFGNPSQLSFSTVFLRVCKVLFLIISLPQAGFQSDHSLYLQSTVSHLPRKMIFPNKTCTAHFRFVHEVLNCF